MSLTYSPGSPANGLLVTRTQGYKKTTLSYTPEGWLREQTERVSNLIDRENYVLSQNFWYDATGHLLATNKNGVQRNFIYDAHGNRIQETVYKGWKDWANPPASGYERTTITKFNEDNQPISVITSGESATGTVDGDAKYSYQKTELKSGFEYYPTVKFNNAVAFKAIKITSDVTYIGDTIRTTTQRAFDPYGRLTDQTVYDADRSPFYESWGYAENGAVDRNVTYPRSINEEGVGEGTRAAKNYGDLPSSYSAGSPYTREVVHSYVYDDYENLALDVQKDAVTYALQDKQPLNAQLHVYRSFDGFGNQVLEQTVLYDPNAAAATAWKRQSAKQWIYYPTGELDAQWEGSSSNVTDYTYFDAGVNVGRLGGVRRGVGTSGGVTESTIQSTTGLEYDLYGRVSSSTMNGAKTSYAYDTLDRIAVTYLPDGGRKAQWYVLSGGIDKETLTDSNSKVSTTLYERDAFDRVTKTTLPNGATIQTFYDPFDRPIKITDNRLTMNAEGAARSTYLVYDELGNLVKKLGPVLSNATGQAYADNRRPYQEWKYDAANRPTEEQTLLFGTVTPGLMTLGSNPTAKTSTTYDLFGRPAIQTDAATYTTTFSYDNSGHPIKIEKQIFKGPESYRPDGETDARTAVTYMTYNANGQVTSIIDPNNKTSKTFYDVLGNVQYTVNAHGIVDHIYHYYADGRLVHTWEPKIDGTLSVDGTAGASEKNVTWWDAAKTHWPIEERVYTANQIQPTQINRSVMNGWLNAPTTYIYNTAGQVTQETLPDKAVVQHTYNTAGKMLTQISAEGFNTINTYDAQGNLTRQEQPKRVGNPNDDSALPNAPALVTDYTYDLAGNLTKKIENGLTTTYQYNSLGKVISESRPYVTGVLNPGTWPDGTVNPGKKLRTYRLDGLVTGETSYNYDGDLSTTYLTCRVKHGPSCSPH